MCSLGTCFFIFLIPAYKSVIIATSQDGDGGRVGPGQLYILKLEGWAFANNSELKWPLVVQEFSEVRYCLNIPFFRLKPATTVALAISCKWEGMALHDSIYMLKICATWQLLEKSHYREMLVGRNIGGRTNLQLSSLLVVDRRYNLTTWRISLCKKTLK